MRSLRRLREAERIARRDQVVTRELRESMARVQEVLDKADAGSDVLDLARALVELGQALGRVESRLERHQDTLATLESGCGCTAARGPE